MFFAFLVMKTSGILFFGPSFRQPARKASSGEIYLKNFVSKLILYITVGKIYTVILTCEIDLHVNIHL